MHSNDSIIYKRHQLITFSFQMRKDVRQQVALQKDHLLPIRAEDQVCSEFGLHPKLRAIQNLYNDGDLLFFANTGFLSQPATKDDYFRVTPIQLFAHNIMQEGSRRLDPYDTIIGTGVLGRMTDVLTAKYGHYTSPFSIGQFSIATAGRPNKSGAPTVVNGKGVSHFYLDNELKNSIAKLHNKTESDSGLFAESWSESLMESIGNGELLNKLLNSVKTTATFPNTGLGKDFQTISRLIATRELRGVDVDTFYVVAKRK